MITAGDFRNGMTIEYDGNICQVVEFQHVKVQHSLEQNYVTLSVVVL